MKYNKPTISKSVYYWPTYEAARAYATSVGVTLYSGRRWPHAVRYEGGWAVQLVCSGAYLGPQHVKLTTT